MLRRTRPWLAIVVVLAACGDESTSSSTTSGSGGSAPDAGPSCGEPEAIIDAPPIYTPRWAFEPWISKDISSGPDTYDFVKGFRDRDIPVGAVVLDSPWETHYNTFIPNPTRYPDFEKMVGDLHADDIRVVLWITPMVNSISYDFEAGGDGYEGSSPNLEEGRRCSFFVEESGEFSWWKGNGAAIDFFNPVARGWWHAQQNGVLDAGIDGWKLDFGESYMRVDPVQTADGSKSHQAYSEEYYRDFLAYGVKRRGKDFVTMVRAYDKSYDFDGRFFARKEHAPVAWMGDNRQDWIGLEDALDHLFRSADAGYVVIGSDIGGYLDHDDKNLAGPAIPLDPVVFARWTALGALNPFMQLHGRANSTPWTVPQENDAIVKLYRYWSKLHHELVPFFYSLAQEGYAGAGPILRPIGEEASYPGDYRFGLGDAFLVAPILDAAGKRDVPLPKDATWVDWWAPDTDALAGGQTLAGYDATDIAKLPLFVRSGAIIPMNVDDDATGLGTTGSKDRLTVLVYPSTKASSFRLHDDDGKVTTIDASSAGAGASIGLSRALRETLLRVRADVAPAGVSVDATPVAAHATRDAFDAATSGSFYEADTRSLWIKVPAGDGKRDVAVQ